MSVSQDYYEMVDNTSYFDNGVSTTSYLETITPQPVTSAQAATLPVQVAPVDAVPSIQDWINLSFGQDSAADINQADQNVIGQTTGGGDNSMVYLLVIGAVGVGIFYYWRKHNA